MKIYAWLLLLPFLGTSLSAQEIIPPPDYIKSVQLSSSLNGIFAPVVAINGSIDLSFDDLEADEKDYYYKIEHCDKHWNTSDLLTTEFVKGYAEERIRDYENSFNTLQYFTHYHLRIPNRHTQLLLSGNYRISILNDDEEVIFNRYFTVYEPIVTVGVSVHRSRDVAFIDSQQSVQFSIHLPNFRINNPQEEIYPVIIQNNDPITRIAGLKPQFMRGNQLLYKYDKETAFWAGNEFLNFDTKDMLLPNINVASIISGVELYHTHLYTSTERIYEPYTFYPDINGNFVIRNLYAENSALEADYSWVHFSLDMYEKFQDKEVYVYGKFNNYRLTDDNQMIYNEKTGHYEVAILLKQGFYNYTYVTLNKDNELNITDINGSFDETENEYSVLVYYSKFGSNYDRVIGYGVGSSKNLQH